MDEPASKRQCVIQLTISESNHQIIVKHMTSLLCAASNQQMLMSVLGELLYAVPEVAAIQGKPKLKTIVMVNTHLFTMKLLGSVASVFLNNVDQIASQPFNVTTLASSAPPRNDSTIKQSVSQLIESIIARQQSSAPPPTTHTLGDGNRKTAADSSDDSKSVDQQMGLSDLVDSVDLVNALDPSIISSSFHRDFLDAEHAAPTLLCIPWQKSPTEATKFHSYVINIPHITDGYQLALLTAAPLPLHRLHPIQLFSPGSNTPSDYKISYTGLVALTNQQIEQAKRMQTVALSVVLNQVESNWTDSLRKYLLLPVKRPSPESPLDMAVNRQSDDTKLAAQWEKLKKVLPRDTFPVVSGVASSSDSQPCRPASHVQSPLLCPQFIMDQACEDYSVGKCPFKHSYNIPEHASSDVFHLLPHTQASSAHSVDFHCISCHARLIPAALVDRLSDGRVYVRTDVGLISDRHELQIQRSSLRHLLVSPASVQLDTQKLLAACNTLRTGEDAVNIVLCCRNCGLCNGDIIVPSSSMPMIGAATPYIVRLFHHNPVNDRFHMFPMPSIAGQSLDQAVSDLHLAQIDGQIPLFSEWRRFPLAQVSEALQPSDIVWGVMQSGSHVVSLADFRMPGYSLAHCIVQTPYNGFKYAAQALSTVNAGSRFPGGKAGSFAAHLKLKHGIDANLDDPMISVKHFSGAGTDFTVHVNSNRDAMYLLPSCCDVLNTPAPVYYMYQTCSSFMYELERQLLLDEAQYRLALPVDINMLSRALTCSNVNSLDNLERLEFLGDCLLKYFVSLAVCQSFPTAPESVLTHERYTFVNNLSLSQAARHGGWLKYAYLLRFNPKTLPMSGITIADLPDSDSLPIVMSTKMQADITEAILGACYESRGDCGFKLFLARLNVQCDGVQQEWAELLRERDYQISSPRKPLIVQSSVLDPGFCLPSHTHLPSSLQTWLETHAPRVQSILGYHFTRIEWLLQACVHGAALHDSAYSSLQLPDYGWQRLEYMGDALIDRITTEYLYETMGEHASPGEMTIERQKLVSNAIFARLAVKLKFHDALLTTSSELHAAVDQFELDHARMKAKHQPQSAPKALADLLEAIFGAVFMDSGSFETAAKAWHHAVKYQWNKQKKIVHIEM